MEEKKTNLFSQRTHPCGHVRAMDYAVARGRLRLGPGVVFLAGAARGGVGAGASRGAGAVSYTHLTLPTIYSV